MISKSIPQNKMDPNLQSEAKDLLIDWVYTRVVTNILDRGIASNEKINVGSLAKNIGVSRTPVNTVLFALEKEGIITRNLSNGWVLPKITRRMISDSFDVLHILFPILVSESTEKISANHSEIIHTFAMEVKRAFLFKEWRSVQLADRGYLKLIMENAENDQLKRIVNNLWMQLARIRNGCNRIYGLRDENWKIYKSLSDAIISGKIDQAAEQARDFVLASRELNLEFFDTVILPISANGE